MKKCVLMLTLLFFMAGGITVARAELKTEEVQYKAGDITLKGYLAYEDGLEAKRPGILVVHEWWGQNDYARQRAEMLAKMGYVALALDMYGDGKQADHPETAKEFSGQVGESMEGIGQERFLAALEVLKDHPMVDPEKIAAIGYCFGGGTVLHMARYGVDLKGVVSFHGSLATDTPAGREKVKARILVCHGAEDPFVTPEQAAAFKKEMEEAGVEYQFISYEGAKHSFTNPQADALGRQFDMPGVAYNAAADQKSWEDMRIFLKDIF
jgi:dienelactone hydrolase